jgi:hypothetical protein
MEHKVWDDAVELGPGIAKALLAGAEGAEVLCRLGHHIVVELEVDATALLWGQLASLHASEHGGVVYPSLRPYW